MSYRAKSAGINCRYDGATIWPALPPNDQPPPFAAEVPSTRWSTASLAAALNAFMGEPQKTKKILR